MCLDENTAQNINNQVANDKGQKDSSKPDRQERVFAQAVQLKQLKLDIVVHTINSSTQGRGRWICEFPASLIYKMMAPRQPGLQSEIVSKISAGKDVSED